MALRLSEETTTASNNDFMYRSYEFKREYISLEDKSAQKNINSSELR